MMEEEERNKKKRGFDFLPLRDDIDTSEPASFFPAMDLDARERRRVLDRSSHRQQDGSLPLLKIFPWRLDMPPANTNEYHNTYRTIERFVEKEERKNGHVKLGTLKDFLESLGVLF